MAKEKKKKVERTNDIPSDPAQRVKLKKYVREAVEARILMDGAKAKLNDVKESALEEFPITKKLLNKLIALEYNRDFDQVAAEWDEVAFAYEALNTAASNAGIPDASDSSDD